MGSQTNVSPDNPNSTFEKIIDLDELPTDAEVGIIIKETQASTENVCEAREVHVSMSVVCDDNGVDGNDLNDDSSKLISKNSRHESTNHYYFKTVYRSLKKSYSFKKCESLNDTRNMEEPKSLSGSILVQ